MGNRATVIFEDRQNNRYSPAIELHWNGGPESVYAFLDELDRRNVGHSVDAASARFVHIAGDFFDGEFVDGDRKQYDGYNLYLHAGPTTEEGITEKSMNHFNPGDNGVYVVRWNRQLDGGTRIVRRFVTDPDGEFDDWRTVELTEAEVNAEREMAYRSDYHTADDSIPAFFRRLRQPAAQAAT